MRRLAASLVAISAWLAPACSDGGDEPDPTEWVMPFRTRLQAALDDWRKNGGDLARRIEKLGEYPLKWEADARAVAGALKSLKLDAPAPTPSASASPLRTLVGLIDSAETDAAITALDRYAMPELSRLLEEGLRHPAGQEDDLLDSLATLAGYRHTNDVPLTVRAARQLAAGTDAGWSVVFNAFDDKHPRRARLCRELRNPLPAGGALEPCLAFANDVLIDGQATTHPFDSPAGRAALDKWLSDVRPDAASAAFDAAVALAFVKPPARDSLLDKARKHPDAEVRMEAAWAGLRHGLAVDIAFLQSAALDPARSLTACRYLEEAGRTNDIPAAAREPDFRAKAEMIDWLAHPQEFGRPPDRIDLVDTREIVWPPAGERLRLWLFRYVYKAKTPDRHDDSGVGIVGSTTFALYEEATVDRPIPDLYGLYCCWELQTNEDPRAPVHRDPDEGLKILRASNPGLFESPPAGR